MESKRQNKLLKLAIGRLEQEITTMKGSMKKVNQQEIESQKTFVTAL